MILTLNRKIRGGYVIAFLLLLISYFLIFFAIQRLLKESNLITHTYNVINKLEQLRAEVAEAETGVRGYVITQESVFLTPYNAAVRNVPVIVSEIKTLIGDNDNQGRNMDSLERLVRKKMAILSSGLSSFQRNNFVITPEMKLNREPSRKIMDSIRLYINTMTRNEESLMSQRKGKLSGFFTASRVITIVSLIIAILAIFFSWLTYNHENKAKMVADKKAEQYRKDLEHNIVELKHANAELQELKSIEKFAATGRIARTIAHEVRNPLTNIALAAEQIQQLPQDSNDKPALLEMVSRNATRINKLVSDLLNATRFAQLDFREMDINQLVNETLEMAKDRLDLNNIKVEKYFSEEELMYPVDAEKMKLALLNIIVNAIEAMPKNKGILQVRTKQHQDKCIIEIRDNGSGMDAEMLQKVFEPYFTAKSDGNGLGLTNTQNIILNHKGKIQVQSKPGHGSNFIVTLVHPEG
jgi:signal transduction histidine kinase